MKNILLLLITFTVCSSYAQYAPAADQAGSKAIYKDSSIFVNWASGYTDYVPGINVNSEWRTPESALGKAEGNSFDIVCLGRGGQITLIFKNPIVNGPGADFACFENSFNNTFLELSWVEVSFDGTNFERFPNNSLTASTVGGFGAVDPTKITGYCSKYIQGYGTPFDLDSVSLDTIKYIRLIDIVGDGTAFDSYGNIIYDPYPTSLSAGVDIDAIGVINELSQKVSPFDDVALETDTFWNGADETGGFKSGSAYFYNNYNTSFNSWSGFAYSNTTDTITAGHTNQYSANTGVGVNNTPNYGVGFVPIDYTGSYNILQIGLQLTNLVKNTVLSGMYITNNTYATISMLNGDGFAKKFGGNSGNDPDWFKLTVWGYHNGNITDSIEFNLSDYRFSDNSLDYIIKEWTWVDLSNLGIVDSLSFSVISTDVGQYGLNTPAYFCIDDLNGNPPNTVPDLFFETSPDTLIIAGQQTPLHILVGGGVAPYTYKWDNANNLNSDTIYNPIATTNLATIYNVTVTDANGNTITATVSVDIITDIAKSIEENINIYPNPAKEKLTISNIYNSDITITSISGQTIFNKENCNNIETIDVTQFNKGVYLLKIINEQFIISKKIIIK